MEVLVTYLTAIGLPVAAVMTYLKINKLWARKHIREVAQSISVAAALLSLFTTVPFLIQFVVVQPDPIAATKFFLSAIGFVAFFLIGIGFFVSDPKRRSFLSLVRNSLWVESGELSNILRSMSKPKESAAILELLKLVAAVDQQVDQRELAIIESVAGPWGIVPDQVLEGIEQADSNISQVRRAFLDYLELGPPREQVRSVYDLVRLLVHADKQVTRDEELVLDELFHAANAYVDNQDAPTVRYEVLVVPQRESDIETIATMVSHAPLEPRAGGQAYVVDSFFTARFASEVRDRYRELNYFSTVERHHS
jgi:hypothetical protein